MPANRSKAAATAELVALGLSPRVLRVELAAAYVGLSPAAFLHAVEQGLYPVPLRHGRARGWDVRAIDAAIDRRLGKTMLQDESPEALMRLIDAHAEEPQRRRRTKPG